MGWIVLGRPLQRGQEKGGNARCAAAMVLGGAARGSLAESCSGTASSVSPSPCLLTNYLLKLVWEGEIQPPKSPFPENYSLMLAKELYKTFSLLILKMPGLDSWVLVIKAAVSVNVGMFHGSRP